MLDGYTCLVTGHLPALAFDLRDGHFSELATVQDLLEYAAERHHVECPCDLKIGGRAWCTSAPLSEADCEWAKVESDPLPVDTSLDALHGVSSPSTAQLVIASEQASSTDYLRMYREKLFTPYYVENAVAYKRAGTPHVLPSASLNSFRDMCSTAGCIFVDKTRFLHTMLSQLAFSRVHIIRRPKGFGKTTFLSMFDAYFDPLSAHAYFPFAFTEDMSRPVFSQHGQLLVFALDFADLSFDDTMDRYALEAECNRLLNSAAQQFYLRYKSVLSAPEEEMFDTESSVTFLDMLRWIELDNWNLCFTVDNYTAPIPNDPYTCHIYKDAINRHIFARLCDLLYGRMALFGLIVGDDLGHCSSWVGMPNPFTDLSSSSAFAETIGFSRADVAALGQALNVDLVSALPVCAPPKSTTATTHVYAAADVLSLAQQALNSPGFGQPPQVEVRALAVPPPVEEDPVAIQRRMDLERVLRELAKDSHVFRLHDEMEFLYEDEDEEDGEDDSIGRSPELTANTSSSGSTSSSASKQVESGRVLSQDPPSPLEAYGKKPWGSHEL